MYKNRSSKSSKRSAKSSSSSGNSRRSQSRRDEYKFSQSLAAKQNFKQNSNYDSPKPSKRPRRHSNDTRNRSENSLSNPNKPRIKHSLQKPEFVKNCKDLLKVRLSRNELKRWSLLPFFSKTVTGCFVRVGCGTFKDSPIYRVAEIIDVVEPESKQRNKALHLRHGKEERVFNFEFISNSDFTDLEFRKWRETLTMKDILLPTSDQILRKLKDLKDLDCQYKENKIDSLKGTAFVPHNDTKSESNYVPCLSVSANTECNKGVFSKANGPPIIATNSKAENTIMSSVCTSTNGFENFPKNDLCEENNSCTDLYAEIDTLLDTNETSKKSEDLWNISLHPIGNTESVAETESCGAPTGDPLCDMENRETDMLQHIIYLSKLILTKI